MNFEINKLNEYISYINNHNHNINITLIKYIKNKINYIENTIFNNQSNINFIKSIDTKNIEIRYHKNQKQIKDCLNLINEQNNIISQNSLEFDKKIKLLKQEISELKSQNTISLPKLKSEVIIDTSIDINKLKKNRYRFKNILKSLDKTKRALETDIFNLLNQSQKFIYTSNQNINNLIQKRKKLDIFEKFNIDEEIDKINKTILQEKDDTNNKLTVLENKKTHIIQEITSLNINIKEIDDKILSLNIRKEDNIKKEIFIKENENQNENRINQLNEEILSIEHEKKKFIDQHSVNSKIALNNLNNYTPFLDKLIKEEQKINKILNIKSIDSNQNNKYLLQLQELKVLIDNKELSNT